jgi:hypothetical protein
MLALLVVALALGLNNFGAAIAIGVSGVDRLTGLKAAAWAFSRTSSSSPESPRSTSTANAAAPGEHPARPVPRAQHKARQPGIVRQFGDQDGTENYRGSQQTWHVITSAFSAGHAPQVRAVPSWGSAVQLSHC